MSDGREDFRVSVGFLTHRKTKRLRKRIGPDGVLALLALWSWATANRWTGDLVGMSDEDIEDEAGWDGAPGAFIAGVTAEGSVFLDGEPGMRSLHDWQDHNPWAAKKGERIAKGRHAAEVMWEKRRRERAERQPELNLDAPSMNSDAPSMQIHARSNAPTPTPTPPPFTNTESKSRARAQLEATAEALTSAGCPDASPSDPRLEALDFARHQALIDAAKTVKGRGKPLGWLLARVAGQAQEASASPASPTPSQPQDPEQARAEALARALRDYIKQAQRQCRSGIINAATRDRRIQSARNELNKLQSTGPPPACMDSPAACVGG